MRTVDGIVQNLSGDEAKAGLNGYGMFQSNNKRPKINSIQRIALINSCRKANEAKAAQQAKPKSFSYLTLEMAAQKIEQHAMRLLAKYESRKFNDKAVEDFLIQNLTNTLACLSDASDLNKALLANSIFEILWSNQLYSLANSFLNRVEYKLTFDQALGQMSQITVLVMHHLYNGQILEACEAASFLSEQLLNISKRIETRNTDVASSVSVPHYEVKILLGSVYARLKANADLDVKFSETKNHLLDQIDMYRHDFFPAQAAERQVSVAEERLTTTTARSVKAF